MKTQQRGSTINLRCYCTLQKIRLVLMERLGQEQKRVLWILKGEKWPKIITLWVCNIPNSSLKLQPAKGLSEVSVEGLKLFSGNFCPQNIEKSFAKNNEKQGRFQKQIYHMIQLPYACIYIHGNSKELAGENPAHHPCSFTVRNSSSRGAYQHTEWIKNIHTAREPVSRE